jgi:hypothetical protein
MEWEQLELRAVAGNPGQSSVRGRCRNPLKTLHSMRNHHNKGMQFKHCVNCAAEGRETAAEHERRVNKIVKERDEKEKTEEEQAVKEMETVDLSTHEGCHTAARLLGNALSEFTKPINHHACL